MKNNIFKTMSLLLLAMFSGFIFVGCDLFGNQKPNQDNQAKTKLEKVENIQIISQDKKITWNNVINANSYEITFNSKVNQTNNNYYVIEEDLTIGSYEFKIIAKSNNTKYLNSDASTKTINVTKRAISNLALNNNVFSWVSDSNKFEVTFNNNTETITEKEYSVDTSLLNSGTYAFTVKALGDNGFVLDSDSLTKNLIVESKKEQLNKVKNIVVDTKTRQITWDSVSNATGYQITFNGTDKSVNGTSYTIEKSLIPTTKGNYQFTIVAKDNTKTYLDSESSSVNIEVKQEEISNLSCSNNTITWTSSYESFEIEFNNNKQTIDTKTYTIDTSLLETGSYLFKVKGIAKDGFFIDSKVASYTFNYEKPQVPQDPTTTTYQNVIETLTPKIQKAIQEKVVRGKVSDITIQGINTKTGTIYCTYKVSDFSFHSTIRNNSLMNLTSELEAINAINNLTLTKTDIVDQKTPLSKENCEKLVSYTMQTKKIAELNNYTMDDINFIWADAFSGRLSTIYVITKDNACLMFELYVPGAQSDATVVEEYIQGASYKIQKQQIAFNTYVSLENLFASATYQDLIDALIPKIQVITEKTCFFETVSQIVIQGINTKTGDIYYNYLRGTSPYNATINVSSFTTVKSYDEAVKIAQGLDAEKLEILKPKKVLTDAESLQLVSYTMEKNRVSELTSYTTKDIHFIKATYFNKGITNVRVVMNNGSSVEFVLDVVESMADANALQGYLNGHAYNITGNKITPDFYSGLDELLGKATYEDVEKVLSSKIKDAAQQGSPRAPIQNVVIQGINTKTGEVYFDYFRGHDLYNAIINVTEFININSYEKALKIATDLILTKTDILKPTRILTTEERLQLVTYTMERNRVPELTSYTTKDIHFIKATYFSGRVTNVFIIMNDGAKIEFVLNVVEAMADANALQGYLNGHAYNITGNKITPDFYSGLDEIK